MRGRFEIEEPYELPVILTLSMTIQECREFAGQLINVYPSSELRSIISAVISQATDVFMSEGGDSE